MPQTKQSKYARERRKSASVHYNPIFPGDDSVRRKDNRKARVQHGDNGIMERIVGDMQLEDEKRKQLKSKQ